MNSIEKQIEDEEFEVKRIAEENKKKAKEEGVPVRDEMLWAELDRIVNGKRFREMVAAIGPSMAKNFDSEPEKKPVQASRPIIAKRETSVAYDSAEAMRIYKEKKAKNKETQ
jgi:hypothetical protein